MHALFIIIKSKNGEFLFMNKKRVIRVKNPQLRRMREQLRTLLVRTVSSKLSEIIDKKRNLSEKLPLGNLRIRKWSLFASTQGEFK